MRIFEVGIENFGLFNDCTIHLSPKMNIIQGENEAGRVHFSPSSAGYFLVLPETKTCSL